MTYLHDGEFPFTPIRFGTLALIIARHGSNPRNLVQNPTRSFDHLLLSSPPLAGFLRAKTRSPCAFSPPSARAREKERPQQIPCANKPYLFRLLAANLPLGPLQSIRARSVDLFMASAPNDARKKLRNVTAAWTDGAARGGTKNKKFLSLGVGVRDDQ
jgi:hypothetical protein